MLVIAVSLQRSKSSREETIGNLCVECRAGSVQTIASIGR